MAKPLLKKETNMRITKTKLKQLIKEELTTLYE